MIAPRDSVIFSSFTRPGGRILDRLLNQRDATTVDPRTANGQGCEFLQGSLAKARGVAAGVQGGHVLLAGYKSVTICFSKNKYLPLRLGMRLAP